MAATQEMKTKHAPPDDLLSAHAIAQLLDRSHQGVINVIARLGLEPAVDSVSAKLYPPETVELVRKSMRKRNKRHVTQQG